MTTKVEKCCRESFCVHMRTRMNGRFNSATAKGMSALELIDVKTGTTSVGGLVWKNDEKDRGLLLNFCPWCGVRIDWIAQDAKAKVAK